MQIHALTAPAWFELSSGQPRRVTCRLTASGQYPIHSLAIRSHEPQRAVVEYLHVEAAFMHGAVMKAAQRDEVGRLGLAAVGPVFDVMHVDITRIAAAGK